MKLIFRSVAVLFGAISLLTGTRTVHAQNYVIVVNSAGPATLSKDEVSNYFLKKNAGLSAVDLEKSSKIREDFSKDLLGRPISAVTNYWQQQIFSGKEVPPAEKASDAEVLSFVRANPKGIGYIDTHTTLGAGVKALVIR